MDFQHFANHKINIPKHKGKTFTELALFIIQYEPKYISVLTRTLNNAKTSQEKKDEIVNFINFFNHFQPQNIPEKSTQFSPNIITINSNISHISHIFHISDIHIRLYQREKEYQDVFQKLYHFIQQNSNGHQIIIITGDLLHSKNQLSPECILTTQNFLINLSNLCPTFLIAGNHDALLNNNQRQDSITAIVENVQIPNFHYLKNSAVYLFANLSISVNSLLDNLWIPANSFQTPPNIHHKIALYHGGVGLVDTGVGHRLRGEKLVEDFQGYDFTLLGDIHKYQWLVPKRMAYASSLIAQNFSEWNHPHGVLLWDLQNLNHHYHPIPNNCGFFVFNLINDQIFINEKQISTNDIPNYLQNLSDSLQVKLNIRDCTLQFISHISHIIQNLSQNTKIINNYLGTINSNNNFNQQIYQEGTAYDSNSLQNLLIQHIEQTYPSLTQDETQFIIQKYQEISSNASILSEKNLFRWEILDIHFSNLFAYGENNFIDFQKFSSSSPIGIIAPNSHGKSSLIDIILFALFSKFSRSRGTGISQDIININANSFELTLRFQIGNDIFTIHKKGKREQSNKIKITTNNLSKISNNITTNLNEDDRNKTDNIIKELIGSYDDMTFTNIQLQNNRNNSFKDMTDKQRKEYLYKILKLDIWNNIVEQIKNIIKPIKAQVSYLEKNIENTNIETLKENILEMSQTILIHNDAIEQQLYEKQINLEKINLLTQKIQPCSAEKYNQNNIESSISSIQNQISNFKSQSISLQNNLSILQNNSQNLLLPSQSKEITSNYENQLIIYQQNIANLENEKNSINLTTTIPISNFIKKFQNNNPQIIIKNINQEIANISQLISESNLSQLQKKYDEQNSHNNLIQSQISSIQKQLSHNISTQSLKDCQKNINIKTKELSIVQDKIISLQNTLKQFNDKDITLYLKEEKQRQEILKQNNLLNCIQTILNELKNHEYDPKCKFCMANPITKQKQEKENELYNIQNNISQLEQKLSISLQKAEIIEKQIDEYNATKEKLTQKQNKILPLENTITKLQLDAEKIQIQIDKQNEINNLKNQLIDISNLQNEIQTLLITQEKQNKKLSSLQSDLLTAQQFQEIQIKNEEIALINSKLQIQIDNIKNQILTEKEKWESSNIFNQYHQLQNEEKEKMHINLQISNIQNQILQLQHQTENLETQILNNQSILQEIKDSQNILQTNQLIRDKILILQSRIEKNDSIITKNNTEIGKINQQIIQNKENLKNYLSMSDELEEQKKQFKLLKILEDSLNKDGLPLRILNHYLIPITNQINDIISPFISRKINLKIENDDLIMESFPTQNAEKSVNMHGGMESFIVDIAFKITLSNFAKLPKCNFLFLDEGISAFDNERLANIDVLFSFIQNYFPKTILITHIDSVKDSIQEKIIISKINNKSFISCEYLN